MTKRKILFMFLSLIMTFTFVSCGSNNKSDVSSNKPTKLTFYFPVQVGGKSANLINKMTEEFNNQNKDIIVEPVYTGNYSDTVTKIQTAAQGGNPPEVFVSLATQRFTLASTNMALPLNNLIKEDGDEGQKYIKDFLPSFMEDSYVNGKIYSIPFQRSTMILFYNKDAFKEVGLDPNHPPKNWKELVDFGKKLTNKNRKGVAIALNAGTVQWGFTGFAIQNSIDGRDLMSNDGKTVYFNTPENVEALQFWIDLQNKYNIMQKGIIQWAELPDQFLNGEIAMMYNTTGNLTNIRNNAKFNYGVAILPAGKRIGTPTGGGNLYISPNLSETKTKAAWKFVKFMTKPENVARWSITTGYVPTRTSAYNTKTLKDYFKENPYALVAYEQLKYAKPELTTYDGQQIGRILADNIQAAIIGEKTANQALKDAQKQADEVLKEYK